MVADVSFCCANRRIADRRSDYRRRAEDFEGGPCPDSPAFDDVQFVLVQKAAREWDGSENRWSLAPMELGEGTPVLCHFHGSL